MSPTSRLLHCRWILDPLNHLGSPYLSTLSSFSKAAGTSSRLLENEWRENPWLNRGDIAPLPWEPWGSQHPLTLQSSPACDIADVVVGQDGAGRRQAAQLDLVSQGDRAGQFE